MKKKFHQPLLPEDPFDLEYYLDELDTLQDLAEDSKPELLSHGYYRQKEQEQQPEQTTKQPLDDVLIL